MPALPRLADSPLAASVLARASVLYTDLDGTLLGRGGSILADENGTPTTVTAEAIAAVNAAELPVVMVSGRNAKQLMELARAVGWRDYLAELGAVRVTDRGREVAYELGEWPADALTDERTPYQTIEDMGAVRLLAEAFPGRIEYHTPYDLDRLATHILRGEIDAAEAQALLDTLPLPVRFVDNGLIHPPVHGLSGVERIHAYHLVPAGVSKHAAIRTDLAHRGLAPADAIAIGDSLADLEMAEAVGLLVLVANALDQPAIAEAAARIPNAVVTDGRQGAGWAQLTRAWVGARAGR